MTADALARPHPASGSHLADLVRHADQDRYWSALLAPEAARPHLLALYAFNIELSRIPEQVREPQLGEIRLQWWRDALGAALAGEAAAHPVLQALAKASAAHGLPQDALLAMIDARSSEIAREPVADFAVLDRYLADSAGMVFRLAAMVLGARDAAGASLSAARAYGLTGLMRALPYHAARGQIFLPQDLLARHGVHPSTILHGGDNADIRAALRDMARHASGALAEFRRSAASLDRKALPAFLPLALVPSYLKKLAAPGHRPLTDIAQLNPMLRYALIWRAYLLGRA